MSSSSRVRTTPLPVGSESAASAEDFERQRLARLESVGRMAAGIAHEINTPIQYVGDNLEFAADGLTALLDLCAAYQGILDNTVTGPLTDADRSVLAAAEEAADLEYLRAQLPASLGSMKTGIARIAQVVQSMRGFARADGQFKQEADLNQALRDVIVVASNEMVDVADVVTDYALLPTIPCYIGELSQVFLDLLVNAAHAIGESSSSSGRRGLVEVRTSLDDDRVRISIADNGPGIPPGIRDRIFEPFVTTKALGKGVGQGLALAYGVIVKKHGGTIAFDCGPDRGTTFTIRLPLRDGPA